MFYMDWADAHPLAFWLIAVALLTFSACLVTAVLAWWNQRREYRAWRGGGYKRYRPR